MVVVVPAEVFLFFNSLTVRHQLCHSRGPPQSRCFVPRFKMPWRSGKSHCGIWEETALAAHYYSVVDNAYVYEVQVATFTTVRPCGPYYPEHSWPIVCDAARRSGLSTPTFVTSTKPQSRETTAAPYVCDAARLAAVPKTTSAQPQSREATTAASVCDAARITPVPKTTTTTQPRSSETTAAAHACDTARGSTPEWLRSRGKRQQFINGTPQQGRSSSVGNLARTTAPTAVAGSDISSV